MNGPTGIVYTEDMKLRDVIERRGANIHWREKGIVRHFSRYIAKGSNVLDIGAGSGKLAQVVVATTGADIELVDVVDHNASGLPLKLYDGNRLPYDDGAFDTCLLVFVLHHATDAERLFAEAVRVSRRQIIVVEDTPGNAFENLAWKKWDYFLNHGHHEDIAVAHTAGTIEKWHDFFAAAGVQVVARHTFRSLFPVLNMYRHTAFILQKRR